MMNYDEKLLSGKLCSDIKIHIHENIDSTNIEAKRLLKAGFTGKVLIIAEEQSAGRGRLGRSFYSPHSTGIYMSLVLQTKDTELLTICAASAVYCGIERIAGVKAGIKWVNDLYLKGKKICGILCEGIAGSEGLLGSIIGIGINCSTEHFPKDIEKLAGSIGKGIAFKREELIAEIINSFLYFLENKVEALRIYRENCLMYGKKLSFLYMGKEECAIACDINCEGHLIVEKENGERLELSSGEVQFLNKDFLR